MAFARQGAHLVLASRDMVGLEALVDTLPGGAQARVIRTDVTVAADIARSVEFTVEQFGRLDIAFNNAGVSPKRTPLADLAALPEDAHERAVAVGETGLDYFRDYAPRPVQRDLFERQLELASNLGKPVVIHTRAADDDTLAVLSGFSGTVVLHCFSSPALLPVAANSIRPNAVATRHNGAARRRLDGRSGAPRSRGRPMHRCAVPMQCRLAPGPDA